MLEICIENKENFSKSQVWVKRNKPLLHPKFLVNLWSKKLVWIFIFVSYKSELSFLFACLKLIKSRVVCMCLSGFGQFYEPILYIAFEGSFELRIQLILPCWKALCIYFNLIKIERKCLIKFLVIKLWIQGVQTENNFQFDFVKLNFECLIKQNWGFIYRENF